MPRDLTDETQRFLSRYFFNFKLRLKRNFDNNIIATRAYSYALRVQVSRDDFVWITFEPNPTNGPLYRPQLRSGGRGWPDPQPTPSPSNPSASFTLPSSTPFGLKL